MKRQTKITTPPATLPYLKQTKANTNKLTVIPSIVKLIAEEGQNLQNRSKNMLKTSDNANIPTTTPTKILNLS